ncbi:hypothetical protein TELCIR_09914 [Teladorsagia circumcincta]|uniref:Uncharacterized protein n=1 Tax=Teladorsagia circumcincta TaxID=45464 RepID=A0A2G9UDH5_TELCI|nr:hypothetical protein TELCIR_09914 [Teladorsagia circumcincta]
MFQSCYAGSQSLNCCAVFKPTYVMMRGRCFRLVDDYYQRDVDETDKLTLYFQKIHGTLLGNTTRPQMVTYISDSHPEIAIYPRVYLSLNDWNRMRFVQRKVSMFPERSSCSTAALNQAQYRLDSLGMLKVTPHDRAVAAARYGRGAKGTGMRKEGREQCLPACERVENRWQIMSSIDTSPSPNYGFRLEASFNELEYEDYSEIRLTTIPRFISELGGQSVDWPAMVGTGRERSRRATLQA